MSPWSGVCSQLHISRLYFQVAMVLSSVRSKEGSDKRKTVVPPRRLFLPIPAPEVTEQKLMLRATASWFDLVAYLNGTE